MEKRKINWPSEEEVRDAYNAKNTNIPTTSMANMYQRAFQEGVQWLFTLLEPEASQPANELREIEPPVGDLILNQKDIEPYESPNGHYYYYGDVCTLLNRQASQTESELAALRKENHDYAIAQKGNLAKLDELNARFEKDVDYQELKQERDTLKAGARHEKEMYFNEGYQRGLNHLTAERDALQKQNDTLKAQLAEVEEKRKANSELLSKSKYKAYE